MENRWMFSVKGKSLIQDLNSGRSFLSLDENGDAARTFFWKLTLTTWLNTRMQRVHFKNSLWINTTMISTEGPRSLVAYVIGWNIQSTISNSNWNITFIFRLVLQGKVRTSLFPRFLSKKYHDCLPTTMTLVLNKPWRLIRY